MYIAELRRCAPLQAGLPPGAATDGMESAPDVDYEALRQQFAEQKREEQLDEEGDSIAVCLKMPDGVEHALQVRIMLRMWHVAARSGAHACARLRVLSAVKEMLAQSCVEG